MSNPPGLPNNPPAGGFKLPDFGPRAFGKNKTSPVPKQESPETSEKMGEASKSPIKTGGPQYPPASPSGPIPPFKRAGSPQPDDLPKTIPAPKAPKDALPPIAPKPSKPVQITPAAAKPAVAAKPQIATPPLQSAQQPAPVQQAAAQQSSEGIKKEFENNLKQVNSSINNVFERRDLNGHTVNVTLLTCLLQIEEKYKEACAKHPGLSAEFKEISVKQQTSILYTIALKCKQLTPPLTKQEERECLENFKREGNGLLTRARQQPAASSQLQTSISDFIALQESEPPQTQQVRPSFPPERGGMPYREERGPYQREPYPPMRPTRDFGEYREDFRRPPPQQFAPVTSTGVPPRPSDETIKQKLEADLAAQSDIYLGTLKKNKDFATPDGVKILLKNYREKNDTIYSEACAKDPKLAAEFKKQAIQDEFIFLMKISQQCRAYNAVPQVIDTLNKAYTELAERCSPDLGQLKETILQMRSANLPTSAAAPKAPSTLAPAPKKSALKTGAKKTKKTVNFEKEATQVKFGYEQKGLNFDEGQVPLRPEGEISDVPKRLETEFASSRVQYKKTLPSEIPGVPREINEAILPRNKVTTLKSHVSAAQRRVKVTTTGWIDNKTKKPISWDEGISLNLVIPEHLLKRLNDKDIQGAIEALLQEFYNTSNSEQRVLVGKTTKALEKLILSVLENHVSKAGTKVGIEELKTLLRGPFNSWLAELQEMNEVKVGSMKQLSSLPPDVRAEKLNTLNIASALNHQFREVTMEKAYVGVAYDSVMLKHSSKGMEERGRMLEGLIVTALDDYISQGGGSVDGFQSFFERKLDDWVSTTFGQALAADINHFTEQVDKEMQLLKGSTQNPATLKKIQELQSQMLKRPFSITDTVVRMKELKDEIRKIPGKESYSFPFEKDWNYWVKYTKEINFDKNDVAVLKDISKKALEGQVTRSVLTEFMTLASKEHKELMEERQRRQSEQERRK